jgi:hypothetical protein
MVAVSVARPARGILDTSAVIQLTRITDPTVDPVLNWRGTMILVQASGHDPTRDISVDNRSSTSRIAAMSLWA